jgi:hypothetical protein
VCGAFSIRHAWVVVGISAFWLLEWIVLVVDSLRETTVDTILPTLPYGFLNLALMIALNRKRKEVGGYDRTFALGIAGLTLCILHILGAILGAYYTRYAIVNLVIWNIVALFAVVFAYFVTMRNGVTFSTDNSVRGV